MSFTRENIQIRQLTSGAYLNVPVFKYKGTDKTAPKTYIQANIHGAEIQGNGVIYRLMEYLKSNPPLGDITLVPQCNPYGLNMKLGEYTFGRFDPTTGINWNRGYFDIVCQNEDDRKFKSQINLEEFVKENIENKWSDIQLNFKDQIKKALFEQFESVSKFGVKTIDNLALNLQKLTWEADIVLDFHTGPNANRYLYCPLYARESAHYLGIPQVLLIPPVFAGAMDEATFSPWCELNKAMKKQGVDKDISFESFTVELGGQETIDFHKDTTDVLGIINYLTFKGALNGVADKHHGGPKQACKLEDVTSYYAPTGGLVHFYHKPYDVVKKGEVLCEILTMNNIEKEEDLVKAKEKVICQKDGIVIYHSPSSAVHQGTEIYSIMTEHFDL